MPNPLVIEVKWKLDCHVKLIFILLQTPKSINYWHINWTSLVFKQPYEQEKRITKLLEP